MKKNNKPAAKRYMKTVGMVMASVMVLSSTTGQMVYAESAKDQKDTQDGEKKEEKTIVYLNGKTGNDKNSGESQDEAVKSFEKAAELAGSCGVIRICGTVTVDEEETWELPSGVSIRRAEDFEDALVRVTGCLKLDNVRLYTDDITGDGEVEGAAEKEKVYVRNADFVFEQRNIRFGTYDFKKVALLFEKMYQIECRYGRAVVFF